MRNSILVKAGLFLLIIFLIAPFTFLKPTVTDKNIGATANIATPTEAIAKIQAKEPLEVKPTKAVKQKIEHPLHNIALPDFAAINDIKTKKKQFFSFIKPFVIKHNQKILDTRKQLITWLEKVSFGLPLTEREHQALNRLAKRYQVNKNVSTVTKLDVLLTRVDVIPMPLVLVQAANESAWGTSRFSRIGLNFFGIWCYEKGCGMIPSGRSTGKIHEVAAFQSIEEAVERYYKNINTNEAYNVFRTIRSTLRAEKQQLAPTILATGLLPYSERGIDYVNDITDMLRHNQAYF